MVQVSLPFKDQTSANAVKRQMRDLSHKIGNTLQPGFVSRRLELHFKPREIKSPIINAICRHFSAAYGDTSLLKESQFRILKKYQGKLDCLVYEMLFIKQRNPCLNTQTDSIRAKLFVKKNIPLLIVFLVFKHILSFTI